MAEAGIAAVFENLNAQLGGLSTVMKAQGVAQIVTPYDGDPKKFKDWIKSIEKYASLTGIEGDGIKAVAFQSSKGCVSDFIQRRKELPAQREHPDTWPQLKAELSKRFAEVTDSAHALLLLRKIKQRPGEGVQIFAERLLTLAEDAYAGLGDNSLEAVERQLIGFFVDGLTHDYMKLKIMRESPNRLQTAVCIAMDEQSLRKRFTLRTGHDDCRQEQGPEPMQVDHYRPNRGLCYNCHRRGHVAKNCMLKKKMSVNAAEHSSNQYSGQVTCWRCGKKGHIKKNCRVVLSEKSQGQGQGN